MPVSPRRARSGLAALAAVLAVAGLTAAATNSAAATTPAVHDTPIIVIDPGHSRTIHAIDKKTGLNVSDYENEPEMRNVFSVAQLVAARLRSLGYKVVMTKTSLNQRRSLGQRAAIANAAHADLALSIHDQAGANGGIGFRRGNNVVYYQAVGDYRATASGHHVVVRNKQVAALSKKYAKAFAKARGRVQHVKPHVMGNVGYNLGSRGLAPGDIWLVQLLAKMPWIYNEAGGNSAGMSGLSAADKQRYANGLVAAVKICVPV
jgi:N-acetylmuramoyl-L-alanine amidase